jgi:vesicular inhibitory amino acid transporter
VLFRSLIVLGLLFISETIPDFGSILDLVGGSTVTLLTFVFPPFFYMRLVDMGIENKEWKQR